MRLLLNAGFGEPIGAETLALIKSLGFSGVRQDVLNPATVSTLVDELVQADLDGLFIVRDLTCALAAADATSRWPGFDLELGNEEDSKRKPSDYADWVFFVADRIRDGYGRRPSMFTAGITTTDKKRLAWLREVYATGNVPDNVHCAIHTYRQETPPWQPKPGFRSRAEEYRAVREIIGPKRRLIVSEIGWHTAPYKVKTGWFGSEERRLTDSEVARYAVEECKIAEANGVESLTYFQLNDGPDPAQYEHRFGIRRQDGSLKPVADALKRFATS